MPACVYCHEQVYLAVRRGSILALQVADNKAHDCKPRRRRKWREPKGPVKPLGLGKGPERRPDL